MRVPNGEVFCPYFFFFFFSVFFSFFFSDFFCLFLFRIIFIRICYGINRNLLCLDKQRSGLVTCSKWWAMRYSRKIQTDDREGNFQGVHEKLVEFLRVLDFDLWNFHQQGQGFHSVREVWEFFRASGKVRKIRYILENKKVREKSEESFYPCRFLTSIKKSYARRNVCSWIVYNNQLYKWPYYLRLALRWFNISNPFYFNLSEAVFYLDQERKTHAMNCAASLLRCSLVV